ncbi:unnamed protein product [Parajaminaea phylloscopi]
MSGNAGDTTRTGQPSTGTSSKDEASSSSSSSSSSSLAAATRSHSNGHKAVQTSASEAPRRHVETANYDGFRPIYEGSRIDRRELVRLTLQSLRELGYEDSAKTLESEAGVSLEHPSISAFRTAVLAGDWRNAERFLIDGLTSGARRSASSSGTASLPSSSSSSPDLSTVLQDPTSVSLDSIKFLLHQERYLELLEAGHNKKALSILRDRLTPLSHGSQRLHLLSSLVMCSSVSELKSRAEWQGTGIASRRKLLQEIELSISPHIMLSSRRLPYLLEQAQTFQRHLDPFFDLPTDSHVSLYTDHRSDRSVFPSQTSHILRGHHDEVWVMAFSHNGKYLATGSKDKSIVIWSITSDHCEKVKVLGAHSSEVSTLSWSPDDTMIVSASDTDVYQWHWETDEHHVYQEHRYSVYASAWLPDGQGFVTGGTDGQVIFWDVSGQVTHVWTTAPFRVLGLAITPDGKHLVAVSWRPGDSGLLNPGSANGYAQHGTSRGGDQRASSTTTATTSSSSLNSSYSPSRSPSPVSMSTAYGEGGSRRPDGRRTGTRASKTTHRGYRLSDDDRSKIHLFNLEKRREIEGVFLTEEMMSVAISSDSRYLLINQRPDEAQLWDIEDRTLVSTYTGHSVGRDMIRCCFGGSAESFIATGSEDSAVHVYHRSTGKLLIRLEGHGPGSVNTVAWHPKIPSLLASCGDDGTVRIWQPPSRFATQAPAPTATSASSATSSVPGGQRVTAEAAAGSATARSHVASGSTATSLPSLAHGHPTRRVLEEERQGGIVHTTNAARRSSTQTPFPWSMSPARPATPEESDDLLASVEME